MLKRKSTKILLGLNVTALFAFFTVWMGVITHSKFIETIDTRIASVMADLVTPTFDQFMIYFAALTRPLSLVLIASVLAIILVIKKKLYPALLLIVATGGGALLKVILKASIERPRPLNSYLELTDYSFPSGHATLSLIFFTALVYLFINHIKSHAWRLFYLVFTLGFILLIDLNRLYLNAHFVSDIFGGTFLGVFWLTFVILFFNAVKEHQQKKS